MANAAVAAAATATTAAPTRELVDKRRCCRCRKRWQICSGNTKRDDTYAKCRKIFIYGFQ